MLLRASGKDNDIVVDLEAVTAEADSGVPHGKALIRLVDATFGSDPAQLEAARRGLCEALDDVAVADVAGIIANFAMVTRIADATGLPVDAPVAAMTQGLREDLGLDRLGSAANTPRPGLVSRTLGRMLEPLVPTIVGLVAPRKKT